MEIVVGTYDEVIMGFHLVEIGDDIQVEASFTDHSHAGCIKCVAVSSKGVLASGSTDETIRLLNVKKNKELGSLVHHSGTITSLEFHKNFLFSTSEDGMLCLWKTFTWECLRTFKGHKSAINCVSVHPSGKMALTVGKDRAMHTWNLITGRSAYITNLKQVAEIVKWNPGGEKYAVVFRNKVDIYSVETAEVSLSLSVEAAINGLEFLNDDVVCFGGEGGKVFFYDITTGKELHVCDTETSRIKGLCFSQLQLTDNATSTVLTVASSEGFLKIYGLSNSKEISTKLLVQYNTGFRLTCLTVFSDSNKLDSSEALTADNSVPEHIDNDGDEVEEQDSDVEQDSDKDDKHKKNKKEKDLAVSKNKSLHSEDLTSQQSFSNKKNRKRQRNRGKKFEEQTIVDSKKAKTANKDNQVAVTERSKKHLPAQKHQTDSEVSSSRKQRKKFNKNKAIK